jgi:signal transduction histidine kinase/FixJ family two-component response regulator
MTIRILHLDDNPDDAELVRLALARSGLECRIKAVSDRETFLAALESREFDVVLSDSGIPGYDGAAALCATQELCPQVPFIVLSGHIDEKTVPQPDRAAARIAKTDLARLAPTIDQTLRRLVPPSREEHERDSQLAGMSYLVEVVQQLSLARTLPAIMDIVRRAARRLASADGATFVLRDGVRCFYADEDAIGPLWKGQRFPLSACISGWAMLNRRAAVIKDIYQDARIPHSAYRPTFVKSLMMTPIRTASPVGAIGVYWAKMHDTTPTEVELLRALADSTSVAMESVDLLTNLERRVAERTEEVRRRSAELEILNRELDAFSYSVAHDLRSPLAVVGGFSRSLLERQREQLDAEGLDQLGRIDSGVRRMQALIDDLLALSKIVLAPLTRAPVDLSAEAREILAGLAGQAQRQVEVVIADGLIVEGDAGLLRVALQNLLSNAWKFTSKRAAARIEMGADIDAAGQRIYFIRDNGAGFDSQYASRLFSPFQRLHSQSQFPGTGVGLATVQRVIHRHGGRIWAESALDRGACFSFTLDGR